MESEIDKPNEKENLSRERQSRLRTTRSHQLKNQRRKLSGLRDELRRLQGVTLLPPRSPPPPGSSPPRPRNRSGSTASDSPSSSDVVVSVQLSPSRKSSRIALAHPQMSQASASAASGRREAAILARIAQLQKEGKWTNPGKKLQKIQPVARPKTHW